MDGIGPVIGVVGGSGGVGASSFAAVLAVVAGAVLVDLDPAGGGIDVLLGIEEEGGARWSGLRLAGGRLDPAALSAGLPRAGPCAVLAADCELPAAPAVTQVVDAAAELGPVVLDLPRSAGEQRAAVLGRCALVVLLARSDVPGLVAAHAMSTRLAPAPAGLVLRRGPTPRSEATRLVGVPLVGELAALEGPRQAPDLRRPPRVAVQVARGVLAALAAGERAA